MGEQLRDRAETKELVLPERQLECQNDRGTEYRSFDLIDTSSDVCGVFENVGRKSQ